MNITFLAVLVGVLVMIYYSGILNKDENFSSKLDNYCKTVINRNMCKHHVQAVSRFSTNNMDISSTDTQIISNKNCIRQCHLHFQQIRKKGYTSRPTRDQVLYAKYFKLLNKSLNDDRKFYNKYKRYDNFCFNRLRIAGTGDQDPWGIAFQYVFGKGRAFTAYYANQIRYRCPATYQYIQELGRRGKYDHA